MSGEWWHRAGGESEQDWLNRIEDHNPSERDEVWAVASRARKERRHQGDPLNVVTAVGDNASVRVDCEGKTTAPESAGNASEGLTNGLLRSHDG